MLERKVGSVGTDKHSWQRQTIGIIFNATRSLLDFRKLVSYLKGRNEGLLSELFQSFFGCFPVDIEEVVVVGLVLPAYLIENYSEQAEAIKFSVNLSQSFAHILPLVLHCKKSISNNIKPVSLYQWPKLHNLGLLFQSDVIRCQSSARHSYAWLIVDHLVEL